MNIIRLQGDTEKRSGIRYMRNLPASLTMFSFMSPVHRPVKSIIIPYMLAGTGRGITLLSNSPTSDIAKIISNCTMYFIP